MKGLSADSVCVPVSEGVSGSDQGVAVRVGGSRERERCATRDPSARVPLTLTQNATRVPPTNTLTLPLSLTLAATRAPACFACGRQAAMCSLWLIRLQRLAGAGLPLPPPPFLKRFHSMGSKAQRPQPSSRMAKAPAK
jgi:hypothetical protein